MMARMSDQLVAADWDIVKGLLPRDWEAGARQCGALRRCRNVKNAETLLRLIFLHVAGGLSLRQTVVRAKALGWATLSDVALLKRLRASAHWLESLCLGLGRPWDWPAGLPVDRVRCVFQDRKGVGSWFCHIIRHSRQPLPAP